MAPRVRAQEAEGLDKRLRTGDERARQEAVRELAALGTAEGWRLVLRSLDDAHPRVADEAQLRLGELADLAHLELVLGRDGLGSRRSEVAQRAAEAIGRMPVALDPSSVLRALQTDDRYLRRMLLWSIERASRAGRLTRSPAAELEQLRRRERDPALRASLLSALFACAPEPPLEPFRASLEDPASAVRAAAAACLPLLSTDAAREPLTRLAGDPSVAVRTRVVRVLAERADRDALVNLVDRLGIETEERLAWTIVESLQSLTGLRHGRDLRPWTELVEELPREWRAGERSTARELGRTSAAFAGLPVLSRRVVFLVDMSGSMWEQGKDGRTRKEAVDEEVRRLLSSLPEDTEFNLVPYTETPLPWRKQLARATPVNVSKAIEDFEALKIRGKGNFWDALLGALTDPRADSVMVLTDGAPTGGRRWNLELMRILLEEENRYRNVVLDAVLFDASKGLQRLWRELCASTGGRCQVAEL